MSNQQQFSTSDPDNNLYFNGTALEYLQDIPQDMNASAIYMTHPTSAIDGVNNNLNTTQFIQHPSSISFFQPGVLDQQQQTSQPQQTSQEQQQNQSELQQQQFNGIFDNMIASQDFQFIAPSDDGISYASKPMLKAVASMPNIKPATFSHLTKSDTSAPNTRKRIPAAKTQILEASFQRNPKPDRESRDALSKETNIPLRNIQVCSLIFFFFFLLVFFVFSL